MRRLFLILILMASIAPSRAENCRYATVMTTNSTAAAFIQISEGESGEIVNAQYPWNGLNTIPVFIQKDGIEAQGFPQGYPTGNGLQGRGTIVAGPARIKLYGYGAPWTPALLTVKITPESYDPNKTVVLPAGTNQVYVCLEFSTNLVNWGTTTNGVYGRPDAAHFFRIRMGTPPAR